MTRRCLTDEQKGRLWKRLLEVDRRADEGTIGFQEIMDVLQHSIIEPRLPNIVIFESYTVALLPSQKISIAQLVTDGFYDEFDSRIIKSGFCREDYFVQQAKVLTATTIQLDLFANKNRVIQSLRRKGLRPLSSREFLCFGKSNSKRIPIGPPIVAVGAYWNTSYDRPFEYLHLEGSKNQRILKLKPEPEGGWGTDYIFIGFPIINTEASWSIVS